MRLILFAAIYLILQVCLLSGLNCTPNEKSYDLSDIEGAFWSDVENPTADFAIIGNQIWLDLDSKLRLCSIVISDTLVYVLGLEVGEVRRRIVSLRDKRLVLENLIEDEKVRTAYVRAR